MESLAALPEAEKPSELLEVCGVCGNPDVVREDDNDNDESWTLNWVECEVCRQWFHQECLGVNIDTNDFICSDNCVEKDNSSKKSKTNVKRTVTSFKNNNGNNNNNNNNNNNL